MNKLPEGWKQTGPDRYEDSHYVVTRDGSQWRRTHKKRTYGVDGLYSKHASRKDAMGLR